MKKRLLLLLLATLSLLPARAYDFEVDGIYYSINKDLSTCSVIFKDSNFNSYIGDIVIPASVINCTDHGCVRYSVTEITEFAFANCTGLTSVTIPHSLKDIGEDAFDGCFSLSSVYISDLTAWCNIYFETFYSNPLLYAGHLFLNGEEVKDLVIPNSITQIGDFAFLGCRGLTSVTIPNSVTKIGGESFSGCYGLTSVTIGNSVTEIGYSAFFHCSGLTSITIPNSVTRIKDKAFNSCTGIKTLILEDGESTLSLGYNFEKLSSTLFGKGLFYDCPLETVYLGRNLEYINMDVYGFSPFYEITTLKKLTIGNSVTEIGADAFGFCSGLTSAIIGNSVNKINCAAFVECSALSSIMIPSSVTKIGGEVFSGCSSLSSVHISDLAAWCNISFGDCYSNPLSEAHHLFLNGEEVKDLVIPNSVTEIRKCAFYGCLGLSSVIIPSSVTKIGEFAFSDCDGFTSLTIPNSVTSIGDGAFYGCSGLTSVTIGNSVTKIGEDAFNCCLDLTSVTIGNSVTDIGERAFSSCSSLSSVHISDLAAWCNISFGDCYSNPLSEAHYLFLNGEEVKDLVIPSSLTEIGKCVFYGCAGLTSVTIPNHVTKIGDDAFNSCYGLTSVTIGNSVSEICNNAFYGCNGLISVTIPNSINSIGFHAFDECSGLTSVTYLSEDPIISYAYIRVFSDETYKTATLNYLKSAEDKIATTEPWCYFKNRVGRDADFVDGIDEACSVVETESVVYNLRGAKVGSSTEGLPKGVYIVREGSETKKISL